MPNTPTKQLPDWYHPTDPDDMVSFNEYDVCYRFPLIPEGMSEPTRIFHAPYKARFTPKMKPVFFCDVFFDPGNGEYGSVCDAFQTSCRKTQDGRDLVFTVYPSHLPKWRELARGDLIPLGDDPALIIVADSMTLNPEFMREPTPNRAARRKTQKQNRWGYRV